MPDAWILSPAFYIRLEPSRARSGHIIGVRECAYTPIRPTSRPALHWYVRRVNRATVGACPQQATEIEQRRMLLQTRSGYVLQYKKNMKVANRISQTSTPFARCCTAAATRIAPAGHANHNIAGVTSSAWRFRRLLRLGAVTSRKMWHATCRLGCR
jgi:hypothetical protein